ncbi:MAG TPA: hypothetical protein VLV83_02915 [Acidobacteriota bacterium]|nr:hypothetical protein [Acidobacteriota bacterium]
MRTKRRGIDGLAASVLAALASAGVTVGVFWMATNVFWSYGWTLFVVLPAVQGFLSVLLARGAGTHSVGEALKSASVSVFLAGTIMAVALFEGLLCLIMAAPLAFPLAWAGALAAYFLRRESWEKWSSSGFSSLIAAVLVLMAYGESQLLPEPPVFQVATSLEIQAPPEDVWREVIAVSELPDPKEWLFRAGIAYPIRAELKGRGVGAERRCIFSTGAFVEPIEVWDEPRLLKFRVESNPPPMEEWTLYGSAHPPHLEGFLESVGGQFRLEPVPGGGTRLEGTTWYRHSMWPAFYWKLWSDAIIHKIHLRVLRHIRDSAQEHPVPTRLSRGWSASVTTNR